jgi:hypothetical protein
LPGGGLVQEVDGKQACRLAMNGGLVQTDPTNGGIARGGCAEHFVRALRDTYPLEWVALHIEGASESPSPARFWSSIEMKGPSSLRMISFDYTGSHFRSFLLTSTIYAD